MGEIFLASLRREGGFEKALAVKRILPHLADDESFVKMFESEARLSALLNHPNIVHIYDFGSVDGQAYLAMELVDGFDLKTMLAMAQETGKPLPVALAVRIASECARALDYAHRRQGPDGEPLRLVHRDVSPQNILISLEGETKLTDFGLAKALSADSGSLAGMVKGKLGYMAPEQIRGDPVDARTDIFALGAVLYELVSGRRVYPPELPMAELVATVTHAKVTPLEDGDAPQAVRDIIHRTLKADPGDRFPTAGALERALREAIAELGTGDTGVMMGAYMRQFADRRRVIPEVQPDGTVVSRKPIVQRNDASATAFEETRLADAPIADTPDDTAAVPEVEPPAPPPRATIPLILGAVIAAVVVFFAWPDEEPRPTDPPPKTPPRQLLPVVARPLDASPIRRVRRALHDANIPAGLIIKPDRPNARCFAIDLLRDLKRSVSCGEKLALRSGPHRVVVLADGFLPKTVEVELEAGITRMLEVSLQRAAPVTCTVALTTTPSGAAVVLDGKAVTGTTPLTLNAVSAGEHTLALKAIGHAPHQAAFKCSEDGPEALSYTLNRRRITVQIGAAKRVVSAGGTFSKTVTLGALKAKFRVRASAVGAHVRIDAMPFAQVKLDGRPKGATPVSFRVAAGRAHSVTFVRDGKPAGRVALRVLISR